MTVAKSVTESPPTVRLVRRAAWTLACGAVLVSGWAAWARAASFGSSIRAGDVLSDGDPEAIRAVDIDLVDRRLELRRRGTTRLSVFHLDRRSGAAHACEGNGAARALLGAFARARATSDEVDAPPLSRAEHAEIRITRIGDRDERETIVVADPPGVRGESFVRVRPSFRGERRVWTKIDEDIERAVRSGCAILGEPTTTIGVGRR